MNSHSPEVSICIVSWNTKEILKKCLNSLYLDSWNLSKEVIVVDNASTDGSPELVEREFPQVRLIRNKENLFFGRGANFALESSSGHNILILNSDTLITPPQVEQMSAFLNNNESAGACGPRLVNAKGIPERFTGRFPSLKREILRFLGLSWLPNLSFLFRRTPYMTGWLPGSCLMVKGEIGRRIGFFNEDYTFYFEDVDFCYRIWRSGHSVWLLPACKVVHLHSRSSEKMDQHQRYNYRHQGRKIFCLKHYGLRQHRLISLVVVGNLCKRLVLAFILNLLCLGCSRRAREALRMAVYALRAGLSYSK